MICKIEFKSCLWLGSVGLINEFVFFIVLFKIILCFIFFWYFVDNLCFLVLYVMFLVFFFNELKMNVNGGDCIDKLIIWGSIRVFFFIVLIVFKIFIVRILDI